MNTCAWCGCAVDERKADPDGSHPCFSDCIQALKGKVARLERANAALTQELIDERVLTASLTEQMERCETYPLDGTRINADELGSEDL